MTLKTSGNFFSIIVSHFEALFTESQCFQTYRPSQGSVGYPQLSKGQLRTSSSHEFDSLTEILIVKAQCDDVFLVAVFIIESDEGVASNHIKTAMPLPT